MNSLIESSFQFLGIAWTFVLALLALFYAIVAATVPFWIWGLRSDLKALREELGAAQLADRKRSEASAAEASAAVRDLRVIRKLMTGETTPEDERARAEDVQAVADAEREDRLQVAARMAGISR